MSDFREGYQKALARLEKDANEEQRLRRGLEKQLEIMANLAIKATQRITQLEAENKALRERLT